MNHIWSEVRMSEYEFEDALVTTTSHTGEVPSGTPKRKAAVEPDGKSERHAPKDLEDWLLAVYGKTRSD